MADYGLIETGGGDIRYTDLAKMILHGEEEEIGKAKEKAVRNVPLFAEIFDRYGVNFTEDQLRLFLREKAGVDISEVATLAGEIGRLMKKASLYLTPAPGPGRKTSPSEEPSMIDLVEGYGSVKTAFGNIKIVNKATLNLARQLLDVLEGQIEEEKPSSRQPPA